MEIKRNGSQASDPGPAEHFTNAIRVAALFRAPEPARATRASVSFEPIVRTAWPTCPLGQTLIVTAGCGRVQRWGGPIEEIRPGDVVVISPGAVATELPNSVTDPDSAERIGKFCADVAIRAELFTRAVAFEISQPEEMDVNEVLFRPTRQELQESPRK